MVIDENMLNCLLSCCHSGRNIYGSDGVFFIIWNASAWGFCLAYSQKPPWPARLMWHGHISHFLFFAISPHRVTEAAAYILTAIAGGIISRGFLFEKFGSDRFNKVVKDAIVVFVVAVALLVVAASVEAFISWGLFCIFGL